MDYNEFCRIMKTELPLNRKERFYTGTVLPALLFHNGLTNFYRFLKIIRDLPKEINESTTGGNFLFYTEYNLKESAGERSVGRKIYAPRNDSPDFIIEILKPIKTFIIIEAKMFENTTTSKISNQIRNQKKFVGEVLKNEFKLQNSQVIHIALLPRNSGVSEGNNFQVIYWDEFLEGQFPDLLEDCFFYNYLKFGLDNYDDLVSVNVGPDTVGLEIYKLAKQGNRFWVGRDGGADKIDEDGANGTWKTRVYFTYQNKPKGGRKDNWITSEQFVMIMDKYVKPSDLE